VNFCRCLIISLLLLAGSALAGEISPELENILGRKGDLDQVKVLVVLREQAPIAELDRRLHLEKASLAARHHTVVTTLQDVASATQKSLLDQLGSEKATGGISGFTPHWIINAIVVRGTVDAIRNLALHPDVKSIEPDLVVETIEPVLVKTTVAPGEKSGSRLVAPGLQTIKADRVWHELGITGEGTLVANMDSGVDGNHPALGPRWRGHSAPAESAWLDAGQEGSPLFPVDYAGHGTHVMGTITGATPFDTLGVAPGAEWIATNAVASNVADFDNAVISGFEWMADPDGNPETHDDVPDVCHNSWGVSPDFGFPPCFSDWWSVIDNCEAAGVVVTFSAGNEGPLPGSLRSPGDRATSATNCFTIGSTSINAPNLVSSFSSRGPSICGGEFATKPEVMAPGEDIISCLPGGFYGFMSGTSMAGPHVAGVVALMRQAAPDLDVTTIKQVLMDTAIDLGAPGDDNNYGNGLVDAYAAVSSVLDNVGSVDGRITDSQSNEPLAGATIRNSRGLTLDTTDENGLFHFTLLAGQVDLLISLWGYSTLDVTLDVPAGGQVLADFTLTYMPMEPVSGLVQGPDGQALEGATVSVPGTPVIPAVTGPDGHYEVILPSGPAVNYELLAMAVNLAYELKYIGHSGPQTLDFHLPVLQTDGFESGGFASFDWQSGGQEDWLVSDSQAFEGTRSAMSGPIGHSATSELTLNYYVNGSGELSFRYKVDSEIAYDRLFFYLDGEHLETWSGNIDWTLYSLDLATGMHTLRWVYTKDSDVSVGQDAVWIDLVELPGTGLQPAPTIVLSDTELSDTLDAGTASSLTFQVGNEGAFPLDFQITTAGDQQPAPPWLRVSPDSGQLFPGNWLPVTVELSGSSVAAGTHQALIHFLSNDPNQPEATVTVTLTVNPVSAAGEMPAQLSLSGAVPNPFNPSTDIKFSLPGDSFVTLRVYDVAGRPVRTLVSQSLGQGGHSVRWDGKTDSGQDVASGVYFSRLQTEQDIRIKSMVLVR
jgi:subtilisin family serine protease